jgi:hypothetical protein
MKMPYGFFFPAVMLALTALTLFRYNSIQDFKRRSSEYRITIESTDIESLERAIKEATFQDVEYERISGGRYKLLVKCPPDNLGSLFNLIQRLGGKHSED